MAGDSSRLLQNRRCDAGRAGAGARFVTRRACDIGTSRRSECRRTVGGSHCGAHQAAARPTGSPRRRWDATGDPHPWQNLIYGRRTEPRRRDGGQRARVRQRLQGRCEILPDNRILSRNRNLALHRLLAGGCPLRRVGSGGHHGHRLGGGRCAGRHIHRYIQKLTAPSPHRFGRITSTDSGPRLPWPPAPDADGDAGERAPPTG